MGHIPDHQAHPARSAKCCPAPSWRRPSFRSSPRLARSHCCNHRGAGQHDPAAQRVPRGRPRAGGGFARAGLRAGHSFALVAFSAANRYPLRRKMLNCRHDTRMMIAMTACMAITMATGGGPPAGVPSQPRKGSRRNRRRYRSRSRKARSPRCVPLSAVSATAEVGRGRLG